jgi:hypothetical protein
MDSLVTVRFVDIAGAENDKSAMTMKMSSETLPQLNAKQKISGIDGPVFIIDRTFIVKVGAEQIIWFCIAGRANRASAR